MFGRPGCTATAFIVAWLGAAAPGSDPWGRAADWVAVGIGRSSGLSELNHMAIGVPDENALPEPERAVGKLHWRR